jgi:hypothetical protein
MLINTALILLHGDQYCLDFGCCNFSLEIGAIGHFNMGTFESCGIGVDLLEGNGTTELETQIANLSHKSYEKEFKQNPLPPPPPLSFAKAS